MKLYLSIEFDNYRTKKIEILDEKIEQIDEFTMNFRDKIELFNKLMNFVNDNEIQSKVIRYHFSIITSKNKILPVLYSDYNFLLNEQKKIDVRRMLMKIDKERIYQFLENEYTFFFTDEFDDKAREKACYNPIYWLFVMFEKGDINLGEYYNFFKDKIQNNYRVLRQMASTIFNEDEIEELNKKENYIVDQIKIDKICLNGSKNILSSYKEEIIKQKTLDIDEDNKGYRYE